MIDEHLEALKIARIADTEGARLYRNTILQQGIAYARVKIRGLENVLELIGTKNEELEQALANEKIGLKLLLDQGEKWNIL